MKRQPTGFVARCQCGAIVGALDYDRTDRKEAGVIMGKWLADGCTVKPRFGESWSERLESCKCAEPAPKPETDGDALPPMLTGKALVRRFQLAMASEEGLTDSEMLRLIEAHDAALLASHGQGAGGA